MWDAIVQSYEAENDIPTEDTFLATTIVRNAIGSAWKAKTNDDINRLHVVWTTASDYAFGFNAANPDQREEMLIKQSNKTTIEYEKLVEKRHSIQQSEAQIDDIIRSFRYGKAHFASSLSDSKLWIAMSNEARRWSSLHDQYQWMDTTMAENMMMYAQEAAIEEAFDTKMYLIDTYMQTAVADVRAAVNRMARGSDQLVSIAMVAVPCTVLASIFSMITGGRLFFVYWCATIPMTLLLLGWVIQKDIVALVVKMEERWRGTRADMSSSDILYLD
ncbi:hypothetical protein N0V84_011513 [Fusarium piperis]|uniref:Uncharacterized protein n=1 Tax=Fusarium piperis TaxID=1435070 RepID=A0A9W8W2Z2_9HYPO|nr:hypothetical protein N0V84_011513 [Fusarium piperis]